MALISGGGGGGSSSSSVLNTVAVATLGNITLSGLQTIDSYSVAAGERVLAVRQTTQTENGIYDAAAGAWTRAADALTVASMQNKIVWTDFLGTKAYSTLYLEATGDPNANYVFFYPVFPFFNTNINVSDPSGTMSLFLKDLTASGNVAIGDAGSDTLGFYGHAPTAQQAGVAVSAAGIHAALVALGLITA